MSKTSNLALCELTTHEMIEITGGDGNAPELVGLGIVSGVLAGYAGVWGMAYAYYNFFKD